MRNAKRTDANHAEIRDGLRAAGFKVADLSACGGGVSDLCVKHPDLKWPGVPAFIEVKASAKKKHTEAQIQWLEFCGGISYRADSLSMALTALELHRTRFG